MVDVQDNIILAFRQGDMAAFDTIYLKFRKPIITFCKYMVPVDDAQDITSDVFVKLWRSREQWDSIINVKAFLYTSAKNACLDFLKTQKRKALREKTAASMLEQEQKLVLKAEIESDLISLIKAEIDSLPQNCRSVFMMSYFDGYENAEIAQKLNISDKTVRNLKSTALNTIKKNLQNKGLQLSTLLLWIQVIKRLS
ncbi:RNA polymerase sigma factor [Longitalea arenae]|uniref:RNA polymerase sigma factor n=1 Tax=Longitalea arenae TaxID=2812558 RepID=UPI00196889A2|nr:RNA polymerase sigma-70 factor [Longitalea arenae]